MNLGFWEDGLDVLFPILPTNYKLKTLDIRYKIKRRK